MSASASSGASMKPLVQQNDATLHNVSTPQLLDANPAPLKRAVVLDVQASHIADITESGSPAGKCRPSRHSSTAAGRNTVNEACRLASDCHPWGQVAAHFHLEHAHVDKF
jgi:hypothetical protein